MPPSAGNSSSSSRDRERRIARDRELVGSVLSGSVEAWHKLVDRYTGLVMSVLRQQLFAEDTDEIHDVYAEVLEDLYRNKLREFEGRASLATWLVLVARGKAADYVRRKKGRRQLPRGYAELSAFDRRVFQLCFVEGVGFDAAICALEWEGGGTRVSDVAASVERILDTIDARYLKRLGEENAARREGLGAGGLPAFLYRAEAEIRRGGEEGLRNPEQVLEDGEYSRLLERLEALRRSLPAEDRRLLELRYERGWTARRISERLNMDGQRRVYTALDRVIRRLRVLFAQDPSGADGDSGKTGK